MTLFEYLGVLISVVMGLGIAHLLTGMSKLVQERNTVRIYWVHVLWSVNILIYILAIWWGMFWWSTLEEWTFFLFLFITFYAIMLFLLAAMLYPRRVPSDFDFREHFYRNRSWFFGIQFFAWSMDIFETTLKSETGLRDLPTWYAGFVGFLLIMSLIAALTSRPRFHGFFAVIWSVFVLGYLAGTTLASIRGT